MNRTLDYVARLDPRNRAYRLTAADPALLKTARYWTPGVVLDQGQEGSCVPHGVVGEYLASPVRGHFHGLSSLDEQIQAHKVALTGYDWCRRNDEFEGDFTEGTSVRAGMLWARSMGWMTGFNWAFNMLELRAALEQGPVVVGTAWSTDAMTDTAPNGDLTVAGNLQAGHCTLVTGYSPNYKGRGPRYRVRNSWSARWGAGGSYLIRPDDLDKILFQSGGEAAIPTGRHL